MEGVGKCEISMICPYCACVYYADAISDSAPDLVKQAVSEKWAIYSLREGLQSLPLALHTALQDRGVEVHLGQACTALQFLRDKVQVCVGWTPHLVPTPSIYKVPTVEETRNRLTVCFLCNLVMSTCRDRCLFCVVNCVSGAEHRL